MKIEAVLSGEDKTPGAALLRGALTPLAWLHGIGLEAYLLPYRTGLRRRYRLPAPVIAIGNLTSGGTGKTPMTALVVSLLRAQGRRVAVLSRGHGGSHERRGGAAVVSDGARALLSAAEAGDEPALLARLLPGVPVVVGRDRRLSGRLACERFAPEVLVLDDGMQYWQLHRDLDIALLDASRPFDNGFLLPRGLLREPPSHLARAGVVVLTRADRADPATLERTRMQVRRRAPRAACFTAVHAPLGWTDTAGGALRPLEALRGKRAVAFCGIADGAAFFAQLKRLGLETVRQVSFPDHYAYNEIDMGAILKGDDSLLFVTTEKDLIKAASLWPDSGPPLIALRIGMQPDDPAGFRAAVARYV